MHEAVLPISHHASFGCFSWDFLCFGPTPAGKEGGASTLQRVVEWNKMLEGCIGARERFDAAKARVMLTRDGAGDAAAAVAAAAPLAQEFADKMAELAIIAPELSELLASLTEVTYN